MRLSSFNIGIYKEREDNQNAPGVVQHLRFMIIIFPVHAAAVKSKDAAWIDVPCLILNSSDSFLTARDEGRNLAFEFLWLKL